MRMHDISVRPGYHDHVPVRLPLIRGMHLSPLGVHLVAALHRSLMSLPIHLTVGIPKNP